MLVRETTAMANFMKTFSNTLRLNIIMTLHEHDALSVNDLVEKLGEKQCYVSQQLNYLAAKGILRRRRDGHNVYYGLENRNVVSMLEMVNMDLHGRMEMAVAK